MEVELRALQVLVVKPLVQVVLRVWVLRVLVAAQALLRVQVAQALQVLQGLAVRLLQAEVVAQVVAQVRQEVQG